MLSESEPGEPRKADGSVQLSAGERQPTPQSVIMMSHKSREVKLSLQTLDTLYCVFWPFHLRTLMIWGQFADETDTSVSKDS